MHRERRSRMDFEDSQGMEGKRILNKKANLRCRGTKKSYSAFNNLYWKQVFHHTRNLYWPHQHWLDFLQQADTRPPPWGQIDIQLRKGNDAFGNISFCKSLFPTLLMTKCIQQVIIAIWLKLSCEMHLKIRLFVRGYNLNLFCKNQLTSRGATVPARNPPVETSLPPHGDISWNFSGESHKNGVALKNQPIIIGLCEPKYSPSHLKVINVSLNTYIKDHLSSHLYKCWEFCITKAPKILDSFKDVSWPS